MKEIFKLSAGLRDGLRLIICQLALANVIIKENGFVEYGWKYKDNQTILSPEQRKQIDVIADNFSLFYKNINQG